MSRGLGRLIQQRRYQLGMSQQELARRLGIPTANLSSLEHNFSRWQSRLIVALSNELRLPQIEIALAAGMITDLPPFDDPVEPEDLEGIFLHVPEELTAQLTEAEHRVIIEGLASLSADKVRFLKAVVEQLTQRAAEPSLDDLPFPFAS